MKFNNIEDWCKEVDKLPRRLFNGKEMGWLANLLFKEEAIDRRDDIKRELENKTAGYASVIWLRVKYFHTYTISHSLALFIGDIVNNLGTPTMIANYLQYKAFKLKLKHITLSEFYTMIFPDGWISDEDWRKAWEWQKIKDEGISDNMLDYPKYMESIKNIQL